MKHHKSGIKVRKHGPANQTHRHGVKSGGPDAQKHSPANPTQRQFTNNVRKAMLPRWLLIVLCVGGAFGGTWAFAELVLWNKLPAELVGKWEVYDGKDMQGAIFDFSRFGSLEARLPSPDPNKTHVLQGSVTVEDKNLLITTRNPNSGQDETRSCMIRELTPTTLIVEFDKGEVFKMRRVH
ncbi:MAG TPA: hypothetical protein VE988_04755 [Gemmataceae bacterium]|nr:hypothetical protein [Gemmataceae bacterium]